LEGLRVQGSRFTGQGAELSFHGSSLRVYGVVVRLSSTIVWGCRVSGFGFRVPRAQRVRV